MNVVVVVMDSLRVDHIYGRRARTTRMRRLRQGGLRFSHAYPEGMPTIPARRSIMEGRRAYPFRGWRAYKGLPPSPGWEPVGSDGEMWTEYLQEQGWTMGYVTDNPHIAARRRTAGSAPPSTASSWSRAGAGAAQGHAAGLAGRAGQVPPALDAGRARRAADARVPALQPARPRRRRSTTRPRSSSRAWAGSSGPARRQPFALVVDSFDAHEPWDAPVNLIDIYDRPRAAGSSRSSRSRRPRGCRASWSCSRRSFGGCASSTRPR